MKEQFRLHSMPYAQCHVNIERDDVSIKVELVSYSTSVCIIRKSLFGVTLYCSGTYSVTTARHINRFTAEFLGRSHYHECKAIMRDYSTSFAFPGFACVIGYDIGSKECVRFCDTVNHYETNSFAAGAVRKYYGSY